MFWDRVAGVYDIFVNVINRKAHRELKRIITPLIRPEDDVLECACGTGLLSSVIAPGCRLLTATDFSKKMLKKAEKNCSAFDNVSFLVADINALPFPDNRFDKVVAGNVIHLLDDPLKALAELNRVCKDGGMLIVPTYMNKDSKGRTSSFAATAGKAGADFKRQFTMQSYRQFFIDAGYSDVNVTLADGRIPCAVAVMKKVIR
ncbi:MAG: methyltransferase domain-containing protein [Erysipelotrichaceae bacterium]|nr:methyltransferase domain-containing protein [Erysipelotrichaceae bacterium]